MPAPGVRGRTQTSRGDQGRDDGLSSPSRASRSRSASRSSAVLLTVESSSVDEPRALLAVRLCDVAPDGPSRLVTRAREPHPPRRKRRPAAARARAARADHGSARGDLARSRPVIGSGRRQLVVLAVAWPSPRRASLTLFTGAASALKHERQARCGRLLSAGDLPARSPHRSLEEINGGSIRPRPRRRPGPARLPRSRVERTRGRRLVPPGSSRDRGRPDRRLPDRGRRPASALGRGRVPAADGHDPQRVVGPRRDVELDDGTALQPQAEPPRIPLVEDRDHDLSSSWARLDAYGDSTASAGDRHGLAAQDELVRLVLPGDACRRPRLGAAIWLTGTRQDSKPA